MSLELVWVNPNTAFAAFEAPLRWEGPTDPTEFEMDEVTERDIAARLSAQQFIIEILLSSIIEIFRRSGDNVDGLMTTILRVSQNIDHLSADNDEEAEQLSDIAVLTQMHIANIVERAKGRAGLR